MNQLTLTWHEAGQVRTQIISDQQPSKNPGTIRIGRDPARCDIVLTHPTVSGLHIEIFFNLSRNCFQVRNLRTSNPPAIDGSNLIQGEATLSQGSKIELGQIEMKVMDVSLTQTGVPPTILMPPLPRVSVSQPTPVAPTSPIYGLRCSHCDRISPYKRLNLGCPWCGTSLAAAASVLMNSTEFPIHLYGGDG